MQIREAKLQDESSIKTLYLQAFEGSEAEMVADVALGLLHKNSPIANLAWVAHEQNNIVGHIAFSPVFLQETQEHLGYILAPLAVALPYQHQGVGSTLVKHGLGIIANFNSGIVFVYGDPKYYSRFGFQAEMAKHYQAPYKLQYPEGWQALKMPTATIAEHGTLKCVASLSNPYLW